MEEKNLIAILETLGEKIRELKWQLEIKEWDNSVLTKRNQELEEKLRAVQHGKL